jgi:DNA-binding MarR family transcriptional regulator
LEGILKGLRETPNLSRPVTDLSVLNGAICFALHRARMSAMNELHRAFSEYKITTIEFIILVVVADNPGVSQANLAAALDVERPRIVPTLNKLEKRGLAKRTTLAADGRVRIIQLTKPGVQLLKVLRKRMKEVDKRLLDLLTAAEAKTILSSLWKLAGRPLVPAPDFRGAGRNSLDRQSALPFQSDRERTG